MKEIFLIALVGAILLTPFYNKAKQHYEDSSGITEFKENCEERGGEVLNLAGFAGCKL